MDSQHPTRAPCRATVARPPSVTRTILLVEDDATIRDTVNDLLCDEGYEVIAVADGGAAISTLRHYADDSESLCLVLLDMMLPIANGLEVLHTLSTLGSYVPVVAMSADHDCLGRARTAGAQALLPKPFKLEQLLAITESNCSR